MNEWFTVEEIDAQTFAISEYQHWEETHCYLLCGQNIAALIDTGLGVSNIKRVPNVHADPAREDRRDLVYWTKLVKHLEKREFLCYNI